MDALIRLAQGIAGLILILVVLNFFFDITPFEAGRMVGDAIASLPEFFDGLSNN